MCCVIVCRKVNVLIEVSNITTVVCLVLVDAHGYVLATQRPKGKRLGMYWEFPGGKVEKNESPQAALRREIQEELGIDLDSLQQMSAVTHTYDFGSIRLLPYRSFCKIRPKLTLTEHVDAKWVGLSDWKTLEWTPADISVMCELCRQSHRITP